jgi:transposase
MGNPLTVTIGCDLGDKESTLCVLEADGRLERPKPLRTTREAFRTFFTRYPAHVVVEVGTHSRWVREVLEQLGHRVTVANPRRLKLIAANHSKSDRTDAELLARLGRADETLLAPVKHRGSEAQADLAVANARDALVQSRTRLVNFARGLVKSFGVRLPSCQAENFHRKVREHVPAQLKPALEPHLKVLEGMGEQLRAYDKAVEQLGKKYSDTERIAQPNGMGLLTALVFLLPLEDKTRFKSSR